MLELTDVKGGYGYGPVVQGINLRVERGQAIALLGPNGAGKSTLLNAVSGTLPVRSGSVVLDGVEVGAFPSHRIVQHGLVQVPEGRRIFAPMTVHDNLRLGTVRLKSKSPEDVAERFDYVYAMFPRLAERRFQTAGTLSGGEQQMVAIGRAMMSSPRVLLLDEPFMGLAPKVIEEIRNALDGMLTKGLTMILVEQKLDIALSFTDRSYVLIKGRIALTESSADVARRDDLDQLYFKLAVESH